VRSILLTVHCWTWDWWRKLSVWKKRHRWDWRKNWIPIPEHLFTDHDIYWPCLVNNGCSSVCLFFAAVGDESQNTRRYYNNNIVNLEIDKSCAMFIERRPTQSNIKHNNEYWVYWRKLIPTLWELYYTIICILKYCQYLYYNTIILTVRGPRVFH